MKVIGYTEEQEAAWNQFVHSHQEATFFHCTGWKRAVEKVFHHRSFYLLAQEKGEIEGILPLFLIKSRLFGTFMVSTPFAVYGGVCARSDEARKLLVERAKELAQEQNVTYLELRNRRPNPPHWPMNDLYVTFIKSLPQEPQDCLQNLPRKARAAARQAIGYGLDVQVGPEGLQDHYQLHAIQMRRLGSPVLPLAWFRRLVEEFEDRMTIFSVSHQGHIAASVLVFFFRDTVLPYYSGSLQEYNPYHVNNFMYLKLMEYGVEKGYRFFDFGRSRKGTGPYRFKKNQGFSAQSLSYQYYLHRSETMPNINPSNPKFDVPKRIWQKLPLGLTKWLGPKLVRSIP
jgi:FemAB-related protein (PEP-CTERM system-associated)